MIELERYVKKILDDRGINKKDKEELSIEILDHLLMLKNEYLEKGYDEKKATKKAIVDFGQYNTIGNEVKKFLPSKNKCEDLLLRDKIKCILSMFLVYLLSISFFIATLTIYPPNIVFNIGVNLCVTFTAFLYINIKLNNTRNAIKNIILCNGTFMILEKIFMIIFSLFELFIRGSNTKILYNFRDFYIFNLKFILSFIILTLFFILLTKYFNINISEKIENIYDLNISTIVTFFISIILMTMYYLTPNKFYMIRKIITNFIGSDITEVSKNTLFITINSRYIIPNIGLIILSLLCVRLILLLRRKGIKSIL
ncbi:hypothetical protein CLPU_1c02490 [Gottschalkia purinilytica]|uniref:Uncharacterized protein n=1 Tax=Gottschalkia purinilytica TaxID=1503 RepID=A0A0L0WF36_GOTPU|nr:permease prefix domain 1-containing protein [Gottschalkia purinilytica]KNF10084.1 hypothetical protein CLPU_1c02490 [Gottschalkia purinilytica]